jgi:hypothetical protein
MKKGKRGGEKRTRKRKKYIIPRYTNEAIQMVEDYKMMEKMRDLEEKHKKLNVIPRSTDVAIEMVENYKNSQDNTRGDRGPKLRNPNTSPPPSPPPPLGYKRRTDRKTKGKKAVDLIRKCVDFILNDASVTFKSGSRAFNEVVYEFTSDKGVKFWESVHDIIQWVFPTPSKSAYNPKSPVFPLKWNSKLTAEEYNEMGIKINDAAMHYLYYVMPFLSTNDRILNYNHNFRRISRVAESLDYFGKTTEAIFFLTNVLEEIDKQKLSADTRGSVNHWIKLLKRFKIKEKPTLTKRRDRMDKNRTRKRSAGVMDAVYTNVRKAKKKKKKTKKDN